MNTDELKKIIDDHKLWLENKGGQRANLSRANLSGADLEGADLEGANGINFAQCAFRAHGERGRQLLAVVINDSTMFFCGCFKGDENSLKTYIKNSDPQLAESRLFALEFCIKALAFYKP